MTSILIVESNTPDIVASGKSAANGFICSLAAIAPESTLTVVAPYAGDVPDIVLKQSDGVIFTGAGVTWSTAAPEAAPLRAFMERVFGHGLPAYGSCNGLQLAAVVLGGAVGASPNGFEVGLARNTILTEEGRTHPLMAGRKDGFAVPCIHRDEVQRLPEGAALLAGNAHSPVQAMAYEKGDICFWGVQYHPELTALDIANYLRIKDGFFPGEDDLIADLERATTEEAAAARLGTTSTRLALPERALELANWVSMVRSRKT